ncbi:uncharacterized protein LOC126967402 [Leptidea sinapis]|uniref:uncharacterized protein LOC126967402 n=1 Tax=Leptidea sinapis TaxID=189913 RepID=UPI0021C4B5F4|nr:uncharacterized protein LOC126967402 [Leptidea sinapis]
MQPQGGTTSLVMSAASLPTTQSTLPLHSSMTTLPTIPVATIQPMQKTSEALKPPEESITLPLLPEKPETAKFIQPKPISTKISPSSIPNPSPSIATTKQGQVSYPNYSRYMPYSAPIYSAFQPVSYPSIVQPTTTAVQQPTPSPTNTFTTTPTSAFTSPNVFVSVTNEALEAKNSVLAMDQNKNHANSGASSIGDIKIAQKNIENLFPSKTTSPVLKQEMKNSTNEQQKNITPASHETHQTTAPLIDNETNKKIPAERFSLKTSIPICKIDFKCVNPSDNFLCTSKQKTIFNPLFNTSSHDNTNNISIQGSSDKKEIEDKIDNNVTNNTISTLLTAAEVINQSETKTTDVETKDNDDNFLQCSKSQAKPIFNPLNIESSTIHKIQNDVLTERDQTGQILLIQNKKSCNNKMLLTIQQQPPHLMIQRTPVEPKNMQTPSRPSSIQTKKCKEELINSSGTSSKVVSLKRMHQDNCDENDFENLITENQIYGNKIVVREKSQGILQEKDVKPKSNTEIYISTENKNVLVQPNFVYLSKVPTNVMMIKKSNQTSSDNNKFKMSVHENKESFENILNEGQINTSKSVSNDEVNIQNTQNLENANKDDTVIFHTPTSKILMNPKIVYKMPFIIDADINNIKDSSNTKCTNMKEEKNNLSPKQAHDKVYFACQMDSKSQPKLLITNIRPNISKCDEMSTIDSYEKKKRLKRLKYLTKRETKDSMDNKKQKQKEPEEDNSDHILTPEKMVIEMYYEFMTKNRQAVESESDYGDDDDITEYNKIIDNFGSHKENRHGKKQFLSTFRLATSEEYQEKIMAREERSIKSDAVASAYISVGRIDRLKNEITPVLSFMKPKNLSQNVVKFLEEKGIRQRSKQLFLAHLNLSQVSRQYRDAYEAAWHGVISERKRRATCWEKLRPKLPKQVPTSSELSDTTAQLKIMHEIKHHVNENNKLIIKRIDFCLEDGGSIKELAEQNFSELNKLSQMADTSVKHFSGHDVKKLDFNPGYDFEKIQTVGRPLQNFTEITVPNIYKIFSIKSVETAVTSKYTDDVGASTNEDKLLKDEERVRDFGSQVSLPTPWPGIEAFTQSYKEYEAARTRDMAELSRRNTCLRVESAHVTRNASRDSDRAKVLLTELNNLANEEASVRHSIHKLYAAIDIVNNYCE